eukprot:363501-Chlamydomonas_euryale.AAC.4
MRTCSSPPPIAGISILHVSDGGPAAAATAAGAPTAGAAAVAILYKRSSGPAWLPLPLPPPAAAADAAAAGAARLPPSRKACRLHCRRLFVHAERTGAENTAITAIERPYWSSERVLRLACSQQVQRRNGRLRRAHGSRANAATQPERLGGSSGVSGRARCVSRALRVVRVLACLRRLGGNAASMRGTPGSAGLACIGAAVWVV